MIAPPSSKTCLEKYTLDPSHEFQSSWDPTWGKEKISQDGSPALTPRPLSLAPHASKIMLKILQARVQQYVNCEIPDVQSGFRKGRGTRDQIANIHWIIKKARECQKNIYFCFIDYAKAFVCVDHKKLWKILKEMGISDQLTCLLRNPYADQEATVRTGHGTTDWFQIGKGLCQCCILSPCLFNFYSKYIMRCTSSWAGRNTSWNQDWEEKYQ